MKSVDEITCFCWYLIFIDNHKSLGFLAENQVYISDLKPVIGFFLWETQEQTDANILHVQTEKPITEEI